MTPEQFASHRHPSLLRLVAIVFLPFATGYGLAYFFRTVNALIAPNLVAEIGLTAADLGLLTSVFFLMFAATQLPLGLCLDRFGPRRTQSVLLLVAALGAALFALSEGRLGLTLGRALIGVGSAGGLMSGLKALALWFPRERLPLVNAFYLACGGLGALAATAPLEAVLHFLHWRQAFLLLAVAGVGIALTIFTVVPEARAGEPVARLSRQLADFRLIYRDPLFWRLTPLVATAGGSSMAIQSLWAGPWLRDVAHFDRGAVASHLFSMTAALTAGLLLAGVAADFVRRHGITVRAVMGASVVALLAIEACILLELTALGHALWMGFGFFGNMSSLAFAVLAQHFPREMVGRANTALNVVTISTAFAVQYAIGAVIDLWPVTADGGFAAAGYGAGFGAVAVLQMLALAWFVSRRHIAPKPISAPS